jgi:IS5 family transposase
MRSQNTGSEGQNDLFGTRLADLLDSTHPLYALAARIDWQRFETKFCIHFAQNSGPPALPTRLMVGLEYLNYNFN